MGKALYRKYRSRSLSEIIGQEHITDTLSRALKQNRISHAYLLTGQRGTGKTSVARILAYEINGLEYSENPHFDIIEIDAASNNGVEDVRELRDKVQSAPASAKYKVYIIDEVHMLSKAAFNALLKTLEEPPEHAVFILATTEVHKLPETIISRTQRYSFRPVDKSKVVGHLRSIAEKEKFTIDADALELIAEHGGGSFRDSISLLDQASSLSDHISLGSVEELLGRAPADQIDQILVYIESGDIAKLAVTLTELHQRGFDAAVIAVQLGSRLRARFATSARSDHKRTLMLLKDLVSVPGSHRPQELLELTLMSHAVESIPTANQQQSPPERSVPIASSKNPPVISATQPKNPPSNDENQAATTLPKESESTGNPTTPAEQSPPAGNEHDEPALMEGKPADELWAAVLLAIKGSNNTLYGVARMVKPKLDGDDLTLATKFPFHQKRLNEAKNRSILAAAVTKLRGRETAINCVVDSTATPTAAKIAAETPSDDIKTISNIFGGAELL